MKARDGASDATTAATALWKSVVGDPDSDPVIDKRIDTAPAEAALDMIGQHVGQSTDVPDATLREALVRLGAFVSDELHPPAMHTLEGHFEFRPADNAMIRSGAGSLLGPHRLRRATVCG